MLPETRELFRNFLSTTSNRTDWIGNGQFFSKTLNGGNDNYLLVRIDNKGGYQVILKRHGVEQVIDLHTGEGIAQKGLKGHQEKQDRELALKTFEVIASANIENYRKVVARIIR